jgi:hypothetical protein
MAHGDAREGKWRGNWRMEWVASTLTLPRNTVYPALLPLMRTPRLPAVDWTDTPADLNGLVRFAERRNLVSARVPSRSKRSLRAGLLVGIATTSQANISDIDWASAVYIQITSDFLYTEHPRWYISHKYALICGLSVLIKRLSTGTRTWKGTYTTVIQIYFSIKNA